MTAPVLLLAALLAAPAARAATPPRGAAAPPRGAAAPRSPAGKLGIDITALRLSAAGYMVDVRYRVTDPGRAKAFVASKHREVFLVDEATGKRLAVPTTPKLGPLRQRPAQLRQDREYFVLFANPGRHLRPGDKVTLVAGGVRVPHLAVE